MVQPASSDKWKAPLDYNVVHAQQENLLVLAQTTIKDSIRKSDHIKTFNNKCLNSPLATMPQ